MCNIPYIKEQDNGDFVLGTPCGGDSLTFHSDKESVTIQTELMNVTVSDRRTYERLLTKAQSIVAKEEIHTAFDKLGIV